MNKPFNGALGSALEINPNAVDQQEMMVRAQKMQLATQYIGQILTNIPIIK